MVSTTNSVDLRALPYRTRLVAEIIGLEATYRLFDKFAHKTLYIPSSLARSTLADNIGKAEANALIALWPNQSITLPKVDKMFQQWRNHALLAELELGESSITDLCIKYNLTRQRINQIKHEYSESNNPIKPTNQNLTLDLLL
ncbi:MAG: hypothetical protein JKY26_01460 [Pseudomonas sp.]|nr:hypothetical protein [Pseudomonas sp.]